MNKTKKRALGLLGLGLVVIMTFMAAIMPSPNVGAISAVTDTIEIRVVGSVPNAFFTKPDGNVVTTSPDHDLRLSFENITSFRIDYQYIDANNESHTGTYFTEHDIEQDAGDRIVFTDFTEFGYGKIIFSLFGEGHDGTVVPFDSVMFTYLPVIGSASQNEDDGLVDVAIDSYGDDVEEIEIYLDGELVATVTRDELEAMGEDKIVKVSMGDRESGNYAFSLVAKNGDGERLYLPYWAPFDYDVTPVPDTNAPDTGQLFQKLNISREDYLVTGLVIFFTLGVAAFIFIAKNDKKTKPTRKK